MPEMEPVVVGLLIMAFAFFFCEVSGVMSRVSELASRRMEDGILHDLDMMRWCGVRVSIPGVRGALVGNLYTFLLSLVLYVVGFYAVNEGLVVYSVMLLVVTFAAVGYAMYVIYVGMLGKLEKMFIVDGDG